MTEEPQSYGSRYAQLAREHPDKIAVVVAKQDGTEDTLTWRQLDRESNRVARVLQAGGARDGTMVAVALPASTDAILAITAVWKVGACVLPLRYDLPPGEQSRVLAVAEPSLVVGAWDGALPRDALHEAGDDSSLPDAISNPGRAIASGGSTGRPKLVVQNAPHVGLPGMFERTWAPRVPVRSGMVQMVASPLYHVNGMAAFSSLFDDHLIVTMERFDASLALELIERYRVEFGVFVPTMLRRMALVDGVTKRDFSSIECIVHGGAPCPGWVKHAWFDLLGPERVFEGLGASEGIGLTIIRGDEWMAHEGSVGRPLHAEVQILGEDGTPLPPGEIGQIYSRPLGATQAPFRYLGAPDPEPSADGFWTVGDMGWLDEDGFLYVADRRADLIVSGGANVYPAEVEAVVNEHPKVLDVAVIGLPDSDWGKRVHAVVEPRDPADPPTPDELLAHCRERLARYKIPKAFEVVDRLPRDENGKLRRSALAKERS